VLTGSPDAQLVTFETLGRTERQAQVLGHELAHAAWTPGDPEHVRLVAAVQERSIELARRARTEGVAAEAAITEELRASRY
jgi:hypothetical protein